MPCSANPAQVTQWYTSHLRFNGTVLPMIPGAMLSIPENMMFPPIAGNYVNVNRGQGAQDIAMQFRIVVLEGMLPFLFYSSGGLMQRLLARTAAAAHDTYSNTVEFSDGRIVTTLSYAKVEAITVGAVRGDMLRMDVTVVAPCISIAEVESVSPFTFEGEGAAMTFANVNWLGDLAGSVVNWSVGYQNNHTPDPSLNGAVSGAIDGFPNAFNAGTATATAQLAFQASQYGNSLTKYGGLVVDGQGATAVLRNTLGSNVNLLLGAMVSQDAKSRNNNAPRIIHPHQYTIAGGLAGGLIQWSNASDNPLLQAVAA